MPPAASSSWSKSPYLRVLRAHEHQVLEEVREPGPPRLLARRSHVIPDVDGDERHRVVLVQDDVQPVRQRELRVRDVQAPLCCAPSAGAARAGARSAAAFALFKNTLDASRSEPRERAGHGAFASERAGESEGRSPSGNARCSRRACPTTAPERLARALAAPARRGAGHRSDACRIRRARDPIPAGSPGGLERCRPR